MRSLFDKLAEERIQEALREGAFGALPGEGQPLELEDLSLVPAELRAGYILLKGSGHLPEEMELKKEFLALSDLLGACVDDGERRALDERRASVQVRYELLMERLRRRSGR